MAEPLVPVSVNVLTCRICSQLLRNPATIPCGHNFCLQCIEYFWEQGASCSCPECGQTFPSKPRLTRNSTLAEVLRGTEDRQSRKRRSSASPRVQKMLRGEEPSEDSLCLLHNGSLDVFCYTDEQILCSLCAIAEHAGHKLGWVKEERKRKQEELMTLQKNLQQILQDGEKKKQKMCRMFDQIKDEAAQTEEYSEGAMVRVIDGFQTRYLSLRETIAAQAETAASRVHSCLQTLEVEMDAVRRRRAELDRLAQSGSDRVFLQKWASVQRLSRTERLTCEEDAENPLVSFEAMRRAVQQTVKKIQEFSDREFASIFSEGGERPAIPTPRPPAGAAAAAKIPQHPPWSRGEKPPAGQSRRAPRPGHAGPPQRPPTPKSRKAQEHGECRPQPSQRSSPPTPPGGPTRDPTPGEPPNPRGAAHHHPAAQRTPPPHPRYEPGPPKGNPPHTPDNRLPPPRRSSGEAGQGPPTPAEQRGTQKKQRPQGVM